MTEEKRLTIGEHLEELRGRVIVSLLAIAVVFAISVAFRKRVTTFWVRPVLDALGESKLMHIEPTGRLLSDLQLCLLTAVLVAAPMVLYQMWAFVAAGLYERERRYVRMFVPFSLGLFFAGAGVWYAWLQPIVFRFLTYDDGRQWIETTLRYRGTAMFSVKMMLLVGLVFQLPLVMMFLEKTGLVTPRTFARYRRHAIVGMFIFSMLVTPPDVVSQIGLALPTIVLYELGILLGRVSFGAGRNTGENGS